MPNGRRIATTAAGFLGCIITGVVLLVALLVVCLGLWAVFWPGTYVNCGTERPADITTTDLVGSYVADDGGRLKLERDGTFTVRNVDTSSDTRTRPPLSGSGTWTLRPQDSMLGDIRMSLDSTPEDGRGSMPDLRISGSRDDPWLYRYVGDPDTCVMYRLDRI